MGPTELVSGLWTMTFAVKYNTHNRCKDEHKIYGNNDNIAKFQKKMLTYSN